VIEWNEPSPRELPDAGMANGSMPPSGDPSLELFGHGWSPDGDQSDGGESYRGRHRAEDA
jgi:hypothetical protein